jgi:hypothetical protein
MNNVINIAIGFNKKDKINFLSILNEGWFLCRQKNVVKKCLTEISG